ncbi:MAG: MjaI family restriction endonuclease, partial [Nitrososphaerota archaeon]
MPKEWILNSIFNRFQLGYQKNVGPLAEEIRKCKPKTLEDWENYYYNNVRTKEHLIKLGQKLWEKISTV